MFTVSLYTLESLTPSYGAAELPAATHTALLADRCSCPKANACLELVVPYKNLARNLFGAELFVLHLCILRVLTSTIHNMSAPHSCVKASIAEKAK
jgi:hypothetical protein